MTFKFYIRDNKAINCDRTRNFEWPLNSKKIIISFLIFLSLILQSDFINSFSKKKKLNQKDKKSNQKFSSN